MMVMAKILPPLRGINNPRYFGPHKIIAIKGKWNYTLEDENGKKFDRNFHHLKPYKNVNIDNCKSGIGTTIQTTSKKLVSRSFDLPLDVSPQGEIVQDSSRYPKRVHNRPARYGYE